MASRLIRLSSCRRSFTRQSGFRAMSSSTKDTNEIHWLATYGTLRDDNDSDAPWAINFLQGMSHAVTGKVLGYRLLGNSSVAYPFAIYTGDRKDSMVVRLLSWPTKEEFAKKVREGDIIEGDEYERKVVEALVDGKVQLAYLYAAKNQTFEPEWRPIPGGDWLQRRLL